jgi:hypothetical protein
VLGLGAWSDFHYYATGARQLTSGDALQLFVEHPEVQVGPVALLVVRALLLLGESTARVVDQVLATGLVVVPLLVTQRLHPSRRWLHWSVAVALGLSWTQITSHVQPADAFTLAAVCLAVLALQQGRANAAALLLVLAAGCKPWAAPICTMLVGFGSIRVWVRPFLGTAAATAALYLPFLLQPGAGDALRPRLVVMPDAPVALVLTAWEAAPSPLRVLQLTVCLAVGLLVALRVSWRAVPVAVIGARILLDPGAFPYYHAGLIAASGLVSRRPGQLLLLSVIWFAVAGSLYGPGTAAVSRVIQLVLGVTVLARVGRSA